MIINRIEGQKEPTVQYGFRVKKSQSDIAKQAAKLFKCKEADLYRTAWAEYIVNHKLVEQIEADAKAKAEKRARRAK